MPQLSDTDPEQYNPLHQLDELADGDSCKKQRVQPSLLQQVVSLSHLLKTSPNSRFFPCGAQPDVRRGPRFTRPQCR